MAAKTRAAKMAKGNRLRKQIKEMRLKYAPQLQDGDIMLAPSSVPGVDEWQSPAAEKVYPISSEMKNQETTHIWEWWQQTVKNTKKGTEPALFFSRNREKEPLVVVRAELFISMLAKINS